MKRTMEPGFSAAQCFGPAAIALAGSLERLAMEQALRRGSRTGAWRDLARELGASFSMSASRADLPLEGPAPEGVLSTESRDDQVPVLVTLREADARIDAFDLVHTIPFVDESWRRCSHTIILITDPAADFPSCRRRYLGRERACEPVKPGVMQTVERHRFEWNFDPAFEDAITAIRDECTDRIGFANIEARGSTMLFYELDTLLPPQRLAEIIDGCRGVQARLKHEMRVRRAA
jgi:hypothetical protein